MNWDLECIQLAQVVSIGDLCEDGNEHSFQKGRDLFTLFLGVCEKKRYWHIVN
jgi:hypothetical protein